MWENAPVFSRFFYIQAVYSSINIIKQSQRAGGGGRERTNGRTEYVVSFNYNKAFSSSFMEVTGTTIGVFVLRTVQ